MGIESTPETLCEKHARQWILSNKFMLQIKHNCHKPFERRSQSQTASSRMIGKLGKLLIGSLYYFVQPL